MQSELSEVSRFRCKSLKSTRASGHVTVSRKEFPSSDTRTENWPLVTAEGNIIAIINLQVVVPGSAQSGKKYNCWKEDVT